MCRGAARQAQRTISAHPRPQAAGWPAGGRVPPHEPDEQWMRPSRPGLELWVGLGGHEVGVDVGQLDELHELGVGRGAADHQSGVLQLSAVGIVHLVPCARVRLLDPGMAVTLRHDRSRHQLGRIGAQPHRAAEIALTRDDGHLLGHGRDHRVRCSRGELVGAVRALQPARLRRHSITMHCRPRQSPEDRDLVLPGVLDRAKLSFRTTDSEGAGDHDPVDLVEDPGRALGRGAVVRRHPADVHLRPVREATGSQGLADREVRVGQVDVLADQRDGHLLLGVVHPVQQVVPRRPVHVPEPQIEAADHVRVQAFEMQHLGDVVDARRVDRGHHRRLVDIAHQ